MVMNFEMRWIENSVRDGEEHYGYSVKVTKGFPKNRLGSKGGDAMVYHARNERSGEKVMSVDVLTCSSRLDATEMVKIKQRMNQLLKRNHKKVLLDFMKTEQVDLAGIGILIERVKMLRSLDGEIKLCNLNSQVSDTLRMVGVSKLLESYDSREEALRSFCLQ